MFFPLDQELALTPQGWSPRLLRLVTWVAAVVSYGKTSEVLAEVGGLQLSKSSCWRMLQVSGTRFLGALRAAEAAQKAAARAWSTPTTPHLRKGPLGLAIDGALMYIRDEGWKEFKVACVFEVELEERVDPQTQDRGLFGHAVQPSYTAHLGGPERLGWQAWTEAHRRGWELAQDTLVIGDGAAWIWNLQAEHFPQSVTLVDWYHALEHLGEAKQVLYPEGGAAATRWFNRQELRLYQGQARAIARELRQAARQAAPPELAQELDTAAGYFEHHHERMHYQERREEGWPIGSGVIESAAKQFKARVTGPGMRWSRPGAEHMLAVRSAVMTGTARFAELWEQAWTPATAN